MRPSKDPQKPDCGGERSDLVSVTLTVVFDCGRTENATVATSRGTTPGLPLGLAAAASCFLSVDEDEEEGMFGPLPPKMMAVKFPRNKNLGG